MVQRFLKVISALVSFQWLQLTMYSWAPVKSLLLVLWNHFNHIVQNLLSTIQMASSATQNFPLFISIVYATEVLWDASQLCKSELRKPRKLQSCTQDGTHSWGSELNAPLRCGQECSSHERGCVSIVCWICVIWLACLGIFPGVKNSMKRDRPSSGFLTPVNLWKTWCSIALWLVLQRPLC